jgi:hypothetical protein
MLEYENMKNYPHKHKCDNVGWSMAEIMHDIVKASTIETMNALNYIIISCDELQVLIIKVGHFYTHMP